jgi:hypothetical protein
MIKKLFTAALITSVTLFALPNSEVQLSMLSKAAEKKAIVLFNMHLKGEQKEQFGKVYDEYQTKLLQQGIMKLELLSYYAANYKQLTNETADKLIIKWVQMEETELTSKKEFILKFRKFLSSAEMIRYLQIENRFKVKNTLKRSKMIPLAVPSYPSANMAITTKTIVENNSSN